MVRVILFVMLFIGWSMGVFAQPNRNVVQFCPPQAEVGEKVWVAITAVTVDCPNDIWPKINKRKFYIRNVRTQVYVGGHQVPISASIGDPLAFITPGNLSGNQVVTIREGGMPITANGEGLLNIIGDDIDPNDIVAWFKADPNNSENQRLQMKFEGVLNSIISGLVRTSRVSRVNPMYVRNKLQTLFLRLSFI